MIKRFSAVCLASGCLALLARAQENLPASTRWVLAFEAREARTSPLLTLLRDQISVDRRQLLDNKLAEFKARTGLDPRSDIDRIVIAGNGEARIDGVAYLQGRFDGARLVASLAVAEQHIAASHDGVPVHGWIDRHDGARKWLACARPDLILISNSRQQIEGALDALAGRAPVLAGDVALTLVRPRSEGELLTLSASGLSEMPGLSRKAVVLGQAETVRLSLGSTASNALTATLRLVAANDEIAQQIQQTLLGLRAMAQLQAAQIQVPACADALGLIEIGVDGRAVVAQVSVAGSTLERAIEALDDWKAACGTGADRQNAAP